MKMLKSAWESAEVNNTFSPGTFFNNNIKSAWESAEVNYNFFTRHFFVLQILKVPGKVPK